MHNSNLKRPFQRLSIYSLHFPLNQQCTQFQRPINKDAVIKCSQVPFCDFLLFFPPGEMGEGLFSALMRCGGREGKASTYTSPLTPAPLRDPALRALQLTEALRVVLQGQSSEEEHVCLRKRVSTDSAHVILKWLERDVVSAVSSKVLQHSNI